MENNPEKKKMVVGWFSFTCCEDSTIVFTELLNDHLDDWKKVVEFRHVKVLKSKNSYEGLDVAFVEGAIANEKQAIELKKIRDNSKYVIAIGSCACTGLPSATRNAFTPNDLTERINWYMQNFDYSQKVRRLEDEVKVDDRVNGCPMNVPTFLEVLTKYLKVFNLA